MKYTWKNLVAFKIYKCKLCGETHDKEAMCNHLHDIHQLSSLDLFGSSIYSPNFEYPNINPTPKLESHNGVQR